MSAWWAFNGGFIVGLLCGIGITLREVRKQTRRKS